MRTLDDIKAKREAFYQSIRDIKFVKLNKNQLSAEEYLQLAKATEETCKKLAKAIYGRTKVNEEKSKSNSYLLGVAGIANYLSREHHSDTYFLTSECYNPGDSMSNFAQSLLYLEKACKSAGNAKFSKLTFGAVLEYKPTLEKFKELGKEIEDLRNAFNAIILARQKKYLERGSKLRKNFYDDIKNIHFIIDDKFQKGNLESEKKLIAMVTGNGDKFSEALKKISKEDYPRFRVDLILSNLYHCVKLISKIDNKIEISKLISYLEFIKSDFKEISDSKLEKFIAGGGLLDYDPTLEKFKKLSKEVENLINALDLMNSNDIYNKRVRLYDSIEDISFVINYKFEKDDLESEKKLLEVITSNSNKLCKAIKKANDGSISLLENIKVWADKLKAIKEFDATLLTIQLMNLKAACEKTCNPDLAAGTALEYEPTLEKFKKLSQEIEKLIQVIE